jgi:hypothetical protein
MNRIAIRNLSTVASLTHKDLKATIGGVKINPPFSQLCRRFPSLPMCQRFRIHPITHVVS